MLEVSDLTVRYGPFLAVDALSLRVDKGDIVGIVGANGAGKSSIVKAVGGAVAPAGGAIRFENADLLALPSHKRISVGISVVPEGRGLFPRMSVEENLLMGAYSIDDPSRVAVNMERGFAMFPILAERRWQAAGTLSGGQQQMLAIAMGLMSEPSLLVLDEPSLGLAPIVIGEIGRALKVLREAGVTVLLVEQNAKLTCAVADRIYIIANGVIRYHGTSEDVLSNSEVLDYLI